MWFLDSFLFLLCHSRRPLPDHRRAVQTVAPTVSVHGGWLPQLAVQLHHRLYLPLPGGQRKTTSPFLSACRDLDVLPLEFEDVI